MDVQPPLHVHSSSPPPPARPVQKPPLTLTVKGVGPAEGGSQHRLCGLALDQPHVSYVLSHLLPFEEHSPIFQVKTGIQRRSVTYLHACTQCRSEAGFRPGSKSKTCAHNQFPKRTPGKFRTRCFR